MHIWNQFWNSNFVPKTHYSKWRKLSWNGNNNLMAIAIKPLDAKYAQSCRGNFPETNPLLGNLPKPTRCCPKEVTNLT